VRDKNRTGMCCRSAIIRSIQFRHKPCLAACTISDPSGYDGAQPVQFPGEQLVPLVPKCKGIMKSPALLHSVSYSGSWGQAFLNTEQFVEKAAELGYDGVMLMAKRPHLSILDFGEKERARLRSHLERHGIRKVCVAAYNNFTADLEHGEVPHREIQTYYLAELARLTRDLGGDLLRIFTAYEHPAAGFIPQWNMVVSSIKEVARRSADFGVVIGVQNHHDLGVGYESQFDLIEAIGEPNCKALFDAWAPALQGIDLATAARKMAPVTAHTTVANYQRRPRYRYDSAIVNYDELTPYVQAVPIDQGFIDYRAFLQTMSANGFGGSVAYEMCSPLAGGGGMENLDSYARRFLEFLLEMPAKSGSATAD
jgi:sugar phosphate isomerase/epimerase